MLGMSAKIDGDQDKDAQNELNPPSSVAVGGVTGQLTSRPSDEDDDETDDEVWETVPSLPSAEETLEITIPQRRSLVKSAEGPSGKRRKITKEDRQERLEFHKAHLVCLFASGFLRNQWCNDELLQATALSLIPSEIIQNVNPKSRLFAQHLLKLASYWSNLFGSSEDGSLNEDLESVICNAQSRKALFPNSKNMLLTAAFRALSVRTRLVCSLHPVPLSLSLAHSYSETLNPIHVWSEVYDSHEKEWIPVHGAKGLVKDHLKYVLATPHLQSHVSYVIAFDGTFGVKDVTQRYTSQWGAKTAKLRLSGDDGERWFNRLLNRYAKDWHDVKEQVDETHLQQAQVSEQMPTNLAGFKDHPIYALERHLKKFEAIHPLGVAHSVGRFKNDLVYPRSLVKRLSSREGWLRDGQKVKDNEVPHKVVQKKTRKDDDEDGIPRPSTELYGEWQTSQYEPPELVDGKIPKNVFGNIELFHQNMLPKATVHLLLPDASQIAKRLGLEFARAMTGFDFVRGKAVPRIQGIVVKECDVEVIKLAQLEVSNHSLQEEAAKRSKRAISNWKKLTIALANRERLRKQYEG